MTSQLNGIPTGTENKRLEKLFLAVFFNDLEKVIEFKDEFPKLYAKKGNFLIDGYKTFNLTILTFFNQIIWFDISWREEIMPLVEKHRQRTKQMLDFWRREFKLQEIQSQIEYGQYCDYFYCDDPNDFDEIIMAPIATYLKRGFREMDLKLYNRAQCFDFEEVKKLLEQGAKSDIHFDNDGDSCTYTRISHELSFLATCQIIPVFQSFDIEGYKHAFSITRMFGNILGLAAHAEMLNLLNKYDEDE